MAVPIRILILEDTKSDMELILHELRRAGFDPSYRHAENEAEYVAGLDPGLDVILADYNLPQFDALHALRLLQERGLRVPFIVATASISEEAAVTCMRNGATDYLLKDRLARLGPAVRQALEARKEHEAKLRAEEQIRRRNLELTLLNRVIAACAENDEETAFLRIACDELVSTLGLLETEVFRIADGSDEAVPVARCRAEGSPPVLEDPLPFPGGSLGGLMGRLKEPFLMQGPTSDPDLSPLSRELSSRGVGSLAVVAMASGGLVLAARQAEFFDGENASLIRSVADQLSNAMVRKRLERDHLNLSLLIEQSSDGVVIADEGMVIRYVNPGFERMSGFRRADVLGRPVRVLEGGKEDAKAGPSILETITDGREWRGRLTNRRKDGGVYTVDMAVSPVHDKSDRIVSYAAVQRDITEELEREQHSRQAQKMEAVGRLAGGVAHDFNNLLTAILGYADLLEGRLEPGNPEREDLEEIRKAAERATGLTRQLLAFSRKQVLQQRVIDLNDLVRGMKRMLEPLLGETVELQTDLNPQCWPVKTDQGQIEQVLMNLALNARDAMPGGGKIIVATRNAVLDEARAHGYPDAKAGPHVILTVADTGIGIDPEMLPHLFEPFFTTKTEGKGTGLGLATVYGIVKQSGGHIEVSSLQGKGSTFEVYLPRFEGEGAEAKAPAEAKAMSHGTETILLVEDDAIVRSLAQKVLAKQGFSVSVAGNPEEALRKATDGGTILDMLVTDIVMPGMDGWKLAERVRETHPGLKVLFISGYSEADMPALDMRDGSMGFLQKPFTPQALTRTVRDVLDGRWGGAGGRP